MTPTKRGTQETCLDTMTSINPRSKLGAEARPTKIQRVINLDPIQINKDIDTNPSLQIGKQKKVQFDITGKQAKPKKRSSELSSILKQGKYT